MDSRETQIRVGQAYNLSFQHAVINNGIASLGDVIEATEQGVQAIVESINKTQTLFAFPGSTVEPSSPQPVAQAPAPVAGPGPVAAGPAPSGPGPVSGPPPSVPTSSGSDDEALWRDVFDNFAGWYDNRADKKNPKGPDFKRKSDGAALWISGRSTPGWVKQKLNG